MQHSNAYTIGFAAAVCAVCGFFVALTATSLKSMQDANVVLDRQKNVLEVAGLKAPGKEMSSGEIASTFDEHIRAKVIDLASGEVNTELDPLKYDAKQAAKDPATSTVPPPNQAKVMRVADSMTIYEVVENGEVEALILPIQGYGLWSVLYGYLALAPDLTTVKGITYYDQKETAGLGGEVDNPRWKAKWPGRKVFDERGNIKLVVKKGAAKSPEEEPYAVDGLSGATITSRGVTNMIRFWLGDEGFGPFIEKYKTQENS